MRTRPASRTVEILNLFNAMRRRPAIAFGNKGIENPQLGQVIGYLRLMVGKSTQTMLNVRKY